MEMDPLITPERIELNPENVEQGLSKLVLIVIELLRHLLEGQAMRRVEGGMLSDEEVEQLGITFQHLEEKVMELKKATGLENEDLNINLGPLGKLL